MNDAAAIEKYLEDLPRVNSLVPKPETKARSRSPSPERGRTRTERSKSPVASRNVKSQSKSPVASRSRSPSAERKTVKPHDDSSKVVRIEPTRTETKSEREPIKPVVISKKAVKDEVENHTFIMRKDGRVLFFNEDGSVADKARELLEYEVGGTRSELAAAISGIAYAMSYSFRVAKEDIAQFEEGQEIGVNDYYGWKIQKGRKIEWASISNELEEGPYKQVPKMVKSKDKTVYYVEFFGEEEDADMEKIIVQVDSDYLSFIQGIDTFLGWTIYEEKKKGKGEKKYVDINTFDIKLYDHNLKEVNFESQ